MKVTPLDLRQAKLRVVMRGYDRNEVDALLSEVADDYEQALRESDRLHQELLRLEAVVTEHREHERNLRNTLLTAQRLSDEIREHAEQESRRIVEDAESRAELILQKSAGPDRGGPAGNRRPQAQAARRRDDAAVDHRHAAQRAGVRARAGAEGARRQDPPAPPAPGRPRAAGPGRAPGAGRRRIADEHAHADARRRRRGIASITADFVVRRTRQVVTCAGPAPRRGAAQANVSAIPNGVVASRHGRIVFVGSEAAFDAGVHDDSRRRQSSTPAEARSCPASSIPTPMSSTPAIAARSCGVASPAPATRRSPRRAAASSAPCARRARRRRTPSSSRPASAWPRCCSAARRPPRPRAATVSRRPPN